MTAEPKIFAYCERGANPAFWAEPLNAITNGAFIIAFAFSLWMLSQRPKGEHGPFLYFLMADVFVIGVGSFLFHTLATPTAALADVIPIGIFMLAYFGYALKRFIGLHWTLAVAGAAGFAWVIRWAGEIRCWQGQIGFLLDAPRGPASACFNGSIGYFPAFFAMVLIGVILAVRSHPASRWILAAAMVFAVSLTFRTIDRSMCQTFTFAGTAIGTHFMWHLLNATTLFLLLAAAVRHGAHTDRMRAEAA